MWAEFLHAEFSFIFVCNSTTKGAMVKWRPRLDSAGQEGPEITLEGVLIVVKGGFYGGEKWTGLD